MRSNSGSLVFLPSNPKQTPRPNRPAPSKDPQNLAGFTGGVANVAPKKQTFTGQNPAVAEQPAAPQQPAPELLDGLSSTDPLDPGNVSVDPGNNGLVPSELAAIFTQHGSGHRSWSKFRISAS